MKKLALLLSMVCALFAVSFGDASAAKGGPAAPNTVHLFVFVPSGYSGGETPEQAVAIMQKWVGTTSDAACLGNYSNTNPTCTLEGWLRGQVGEVFNYDITVARSQYTLQQIARGAAYDSCGNIGSINLLDNVAADLLSEFGYDRTNQRTWIVLVGGGGWAAHEDITPHGTATLTGMVGGWGVAEAYGIHDCGDPYFDSGYAMTGYGHEWAGALGMFLAGNGSVDTDDPIFGGEVLTKTQKNQLLKWSGAWLHS